MKAYWPYPPVEADRIDPYAGEPAAAQYVIYGGSQPTYAFADPAKAYGGHLVQWIPMGYMILRHAQKAAVFSDGTLVREWPLLHSAPNGEPPPQEPTDAFPYDARLHALRSSHARWLRSVCGYLVMTPSAPDKRPEDSYDHAAATELAMAASRDEGRAVLWFAYRAENWH